MTKVKKTKLSESAKKRKGLANAIDSVVNTVTRASRPLREIKKTKNQRIAEAEDKFRSGAKMVVDAIAERNKNSPETQKRNKDKDKAIKEIFKLYKKDKSLIKTYGKDAMKSKSFNTKRKKK
jgi:3-polyprenyl-4-hydroxybenzoate decarboxylase